MSIHLHIVSNPFHFQKMPKEMLTECLSCSLLHNESRWRPGLKKKKRKKHHKTYIQELFFKSSEIMWKLFDWNFSQYKLKISPDSHSPHWLSLYGKQQETAFPFVFYKQKSHPSFERHEVEYINRKSLLKALFVDYILRDFINTTLA